MVYCLYKYIVVVVLMFVELNSRAMMNKYNFVLNLDQYIRIIVVVVEEDNKHMNQIVEKSE